MKALAFSPAARGSLLPEEGLEAITEVARLGVDMAREGHQLAGAAVTSAAISLNKRLSASSFTSGAQTR